MFPFHLSKPNALTLHEGRRRVRGHPRAPSVGGAVGRQGQLVHRGSSNDSGESDTGGVPAIVRRLGGVQAQAGGGDRGELAVELAGCFVGTAGILTQRLKQNM